MRIGIIGGSGVRTLPFDIAPEPVEIETTWGRATGQLGTLGGREVVFLARHGAGHSVPPHKINYRANIAGLQKLGCQAVLATTAVGSLKASLLPGTICVLDQLIDFTLGRPHKTFFDGENGTPVVHTDVTEPFAPFLWCARRYCKPPIHKISLCEMAAPISAWTVRATRLLQRCDFSRPGVPM
ncbi:MAG: MTAP family purine nucleoside phosphorylase [Armatimonas sp.]